MSIVTDIADAVAAELVEGTFSQEFTPQRKAVPMFELKDLKDLKVSVVPHSLEITGATRGMSQYEATIDIGVQKKIDGDVDEAVKTLGSLVDEIADFLRKRTLSATPWAVWSGIKNDPVYVPEHLTDQRVFTSVLSVSYKMVR